MSTLYVRGFTTHFCGCVIFVMQAGWGSSETDINSVFRNRHHCIESCFLPIVYAKLGIVGQADIRNASNGARTRSLAHGYRE
jgi:hypothetical protein